MKLVFLSIVIVAAAFVLLAVKIIFVKGGRFPSSHVHSSPALRKRGISCVAGPHNENKQSINKLT